MDESASNTLSASRTGRLAALLVAVGTLAVFLPTLGNGFVNWDDPIYVGSQVGSPWAAFAEVHASGNWHPLATLSHRLDRLVWGDAAFGHHLTSILLHAVNGALVVLLGGALFAARVRPRNTGAGAGAHLGANAWIALGLAALAWSIHPLRVESVAWISERKDLLCAFFFLLALLAYLRHASAEARSWYASRHYWMVVACFAAALMSKPMAVSFPLVLLILDWFPLARSKRDGRAALLAEKAPLFTLSVAAGLVALHAQRLGGAYRALAHVSGATRAMVAAGAPGAYLGKMLWPSPLLPYYSYPPTPSSLSLVSSTLLVAAVLVLGRRRPAILAAFACYAVILLPVLGIVQVGPQAMADRYTYLSSIPLALLAATVVTTRFGRPLFVVPGTLGLLVLAFFTSAQIGIWQDSEALWSHELEFEPDNMEARNSRASYYYEQGRYQEALADYDAALAAPARVSTKHATKRRAACFNDRAITQVQLGHLAQAVADESEAIRLMPHQASYYFNRSGMYQQLQMAEAAQADREVARGLLSSSAPRSAGLR